MARSIRYDFLLNGKGYLLSRSPDSQGRAWMRNSTPDTPIRTSKRDEEQSKYGGVDPQIDYPEVWNDWSGGFGYAYRDPERTNTYHWSENFDARFPRQLIHCQLPYALVNAIATSDTAVSFAGYPSIAKSVEEMIDGSILGTAYGLGYGDRIVVAGQFGVMGLMPLTDVTFKATKPWAPLFPGGWTHPAAVYGSQIWIGHTPSGAPFYGFGEVASTVGSMYGYRFAVAGNQLWRAHGPNDQDRGFYLQVCGNPNGVASPANWGATYVVGNYRMPIVDMVSLNDQVFLGTQDGLYAGDQTGTFVNVLAQLGRQSHPDNCRDLTIFENTVVAPHIAGIYAYRPSTGTIEDISLPQADRSPVVGHIRSVRGYGRWLYAGLWTGSKNWLLAGSRGVGGHLNWHTLQRIPGDTDPATYARYIGRIFVDSMSTTYSRASIPNRLWFLMEGPKLDTSGSGPGGGFGGPAFFWPIPPLDGNPLGAGYPFSANYIGSARMDMGRTDSNAPGTLKIYRAVEVESEHLASGAVWSNVYYTVDGGMRTQLGTVARSPKDTLYFPPEGTDIVDNGDFEETSTGGAGDPFRAWFKLNANATDNATAHSGTHAIKLLTNAGTGTTAIYQPGLKVIPNAKYTVTYWVRNDGVNGLAVGDGYLSIKNEDTGSYFYSEHLGSSSSTYTQYSQSFIAPTDCWSIALYLQSPPGTDRFVYVDDVEMFAPPVGHNIEVSIESFTATSAITPVYRSIVLRGALMPTYTDEITAMVRVADNVADREGQPMRPAATMMQELRKLGNPVLGGAQSIELIDPLGISWRVKLLGPPEEREAYMGDNDNTPPEIAATIRMAVLTFTTPYVG